MSAQAVYSGSDLKRLRQEAGVSIRGLARVLDMTGGAVQRAEQSARPRAGTREHYLVALERAKAERKVRRVADACADVGVILNELAAALIEAAAEADKASEATP